MAAILMSGALVSKLLGFGREVLMAQVLGASMVADGFRGALTAVMLPLAAKHSQRLAYAATRAKAHYGVSKMLEAVSDVINDVARVARA
jgi:hypothetical protein